MTAPFGNIKSVYGEVTGKKIKAATQCFNYIILDELHKHGIESWVAGGSLRAFFENELKSNVDVDVYFPDENRHSEAVDIFKHLPKLRQTENSITYKIKGRPIDFVGPPNIFDTPVKTLQNFDFTVCAAAIDGEKLYVHDMFFDDLKNKRLRVINLKEGIASGIMIMRRMQKYIRKGYIADNDTLQAIINFISVANKKIEVKKEWSSY
ncbi:hypothetical protein LCGC14_2694130 [marine sediment metagenome]|uniref:Poly A polymerase head domain-containing protein n=1 Tax=marine sediment metagenome TaxID=412755 RepID=A0A0F8ZHL8_9ZZZZ